jgi:hypothetical protein
MTAQELQEFLVRHHAVFTAKHLDTGGWLFICAAGDIFTLSETGTVGSEGTPTDLTRAVWNFISWGQG